MSGATPANLKVVASLMCADLAFLAREVAALERAGIDGFHFDIMDGIFVPNLALSPMFLGALRPLTRLPFEAHLMVRFPQPFLDALAQAGCDICIVHLESEGRISETLAAIHYAGLRAGIAINPTTPLAGLKDALGDVDHVLVMTVPPGFAGQGIISGAAERVAGVARLLSEAAPQSTIHVDGSVNTRTVGPLVQAGARVLVGGSTGLFSQGGTFEDALAALRAAAAVGLRGG